MKLEDEHAGAGQQGNELLELQRQKKRSKGSGQAAPAANREQPLHGDTEVMCACTALACARRAAARVDHAQVTSRKHRMNTWLRMSCMPAAGMGNDIPSCGPPHVSSACMG